MATLNMRSLGKERGQALVEFALMFGFLLVLIVGIVELGIVLQEQLIVVNAARGGARFGATGATADAIHAQTLLAASQMLEFTEDNAVITVIQAKTNDDGTDFEEWDESVYPSEAPASVTREQVLADLRQEGDAGDLQLVIVAVVYDHESLLGLPFVGALSGKIPIGSWTAMRLEPTSANRRQQACTAYPIAVHKSSLEGKNRGDPIGDVYNGMGEGGFGWLRWSQDPNHASPEWLRKYLYEPMRSVGEFQNADGSGDTELSVEDLVWANIGLSGSEDNLAALDSLLGGKYIRVVVWDIVAGSGVQAKYHVYGFAIVSITSYDLARPNRISAKFIEWSECG